MAFLDKVFIFGFVFLLIFAFVANTAQHEFAHKTFNEKYGIESEYFMNLPWSVGVRSYGEQPADLKLLHGMNEVVNYNLAPFLMSIIALLGMGFWFIGNKIDEHVKDLKQHGITIEAISTNAREEVILDEVKII